MSGSAGDHWLVRDYLYELDAAMRGLPAAQAHELKEQITAHLADALPPDAGDHEVAAILSRLGSPADLAAEAGAVSGSSGPRFTVSGSSGPRLTVRSWRLIAVIAVIALIAVIAAVLGALQISRDVGNDVTFGRDQHLAQLNAAVVKLSQALEDERDLSAGYTADRAASASLIGPLRQARNTTGAAARAVLTEAAGVTAGAGYQPATVTDLNALIVSLNDLSSIRANVTSSLFPASQVIRLYTSDVLAAANTFSASVGAGANDAGLQGNDATLAALLEVENEMSVQRAVLFAALSSPAQRFGPGDLNTLSQAKESRTADQADFAASTSEAEQKYFNNTVSGSAVDQASAQETLAVEMGSASPGLPLTAHASDLTAKTWYANQTATIDGVRQVADGLVAHITDRARTLRSHATRDLLLTSIVTLLLLVLLISTAKSAVV
jgi:Nitrate and nitrite sensing